MNKTFLAIIYFLLIVIILTIAPGALKRESAALQDQKDFFECIQDLTPTECRAGIYGID